MSLFSPQGISPFIGAQCTDIEWIWEPIIPAESLCVLSAFMKSGKSTLIYPLVLAIAQGKPFCSHPTNPTPVLILAVEEHPREISIRLQQFNATGSEPIWIHSGPLAPSNENYNAISKFCVEHGVGLIVVDTLSTFWAVTDENDNSEVNGALVPLLALARSGVTVLLVHHNGKMETGSLKDIRGASALLAAVDQALILRYTRDRTSNNRILTTIGRYDSPPELQIVLNDARTSYSLVGSPEDVKYSEIRNQTQQVLIDTPGISTSEIAKILGYSLRQVQKALFPPPLWLNRTGRGKKGNPYLYSYLPPPPPAEDAP